MSNEPPAVPDNSVEREAGTRAKARRRFVHGVSVLVPTILTVGARSSLAATCLSPSATASINLLNSRPGRVGDVACAGLAPVTWKKREYKPAKDTPFGRVFPDGGLQRNAATKSMHDTLSGSGNPHYESLSRHLAAAWCNLESGLVSSNVLSMHDLQAMWAGRDGTYAPVAGSSVVWNQHQIVEYLKTTMN